jgi:hypothetical protein
VPTIAWFAQQDRLVTIDGVGEPSEVSNRLTAAIDARLGAQ